MASEFRGNRLGWAGVLLSLVCCLCGASPADSAFESIAEKYLEARFDFRPTLGTLAGLHEYDHRLEDYTRERIARRIDELRDFQRQLVDLKRDVRPQNPPLSADSQIDLAFLQGRIQGELIDLNVIQVWKTDPINYTEMAGKAVDLVIKREFAPAAVRLRSIISRERRIPDVLEAAKRNLERPSRGSTDLAIRLAKGATEYFAGTVADWAKDAAGRDTKLLAEFLEQNERALAAFRAFESWLTNELRPRSTGDFALGERVLLAKLSAEEMIDLPIDELLARGEATLEKDYRALEATAKKIDKAKTAAEVIRSLGDDHPSALDLIPFARRMAEELREYVIKHSIVTILSDVRPEVRETPPHARIGSISMMDLPGPYETHENQVFIYVTPPEKDWDSERSDDYLRSFSGPALAMVNAHEAFPGHYVQFLYAKTFRRKVRKLLYCTTTTEGWAHYCEEMMVEQGFGASDPKVRLTQLMESLLLDCRFVASLNLHTKRWNLARAAKLFVDKGFHEPADAHEEALRCAYRPMQLCYTLGKLEILRLRDDYRAQKGGSLRDFHDALMAQGGLPLPLVRKLLLDR
jgi:uncharacterized protein (DUF885 family)